MPALGLEGPVACHAGRASAPRTVRGLVDGGALAVTRPTLLLPVRGLVAPGRGLRAATGIVECTLALGVTVRGLDECARGLLAVARPSVTSRSHTGPATGRVTAPLLLTVRGLGSGVGGLDGVSGIAWRLLLLPAIAVTLGCQWLPPLRLRVAPPLFPRPPSQTSSGWFSACLGLWNSGVRF